MSIWGSMFRVLREYEGKWILEKKCGRKITKVL